MTIDIDDRIRDTVGAIARSATDPHPYAQLRETRPTRVVPQRRHHRRAGLLAAAAALALVGITAGGIALSRETGSPQPSDATSPTTDQTANSAWPGMLTQQRCVEIRGPGPINAIDLGTGNSIDIPIEQYCREYVDLQEPTAALDAARLTMSFTVLNGHLSRRFWEARPDNSGRLVATTVQVAEANAVQRLAEVSRSR